MRITIEPTDKIVEVGWDGEHYVPARLWEGVTDAGVECHLFVTRVAAAIGDGADVFAAVLEEQRPPTNPDVAAYPARLVL